jgi:hypothetical protein
MTMNRLVALLLLGGAVFAYAKMSDEPAKPALPLPANQVSFTRLVQGYQDQYGEAKANRNDLQQNNLAAARDQQLCSPTQVREAEDWIGEVYNVRTSVVDYQNRNARLVLEFGSGRNKFWIHTHENIERDDPLFNALGYLKAGEKIKFSGQFVLTHKGCIWESSLTQDGSMSKPEFAFRFAKIKGMGR